MAFSAITDRGSNVKGTPSDTTITLSPSATIAAGKLAIVSFATNNLATADGASSNHTVGDDAGNQWTKLGEYTETEAGAADDGSTISLWMSVLTTQLTTSSVITGTLTSAMLDKAIHIFEVTFAAGKRPNLAQLGVGQNAVAASVSGLTSREYLLIGAACAEGSDITKTADADYTERADIRSRNNAAGASLHVQTRIATLTTDTVTSTTWTDAQPITLLAAIQEGDYAEPAKAALTATGATPTRTVSILRSPTIRALALAGATAGVAVGASIAPAKATLTATGGQPGVNAVIISQLSSNSSNTDAASYTTATSLTAEAGVVYCAIVANAHGTNSTEPTCSGGGLGTWTKIYTQQTSSTLRRVTAFWAQSASPGAAEQVTFDFGGVTQTAGAWKILKVAVANAAAPIVASNGNASAAPTCAVTMSAIASARNALLYAQVANANTTFDPDTSPGGWAELGSENTCSAPNLTLGAAWLGYVSDTSCSGTSGGSGALAALAVEFAVASGSNETVTPTKGALTATGGTPTRTQADTRTPTKAALTVTGATPVRLVAATRTPTTAALTLTGKTPTLVAGTVRTPTKGALALTGSTPTVTVAGAEAVVELWQGGTLIATRDITDDLTTSFQTLDLALTTPERDSITDWTDLRIAFSVYGRQQRVSWVQIETPNRLAVAAPGPAELTLTGATPARLQADTRTPTKGTLALTGATPGVSVNYGETVGPTKAALTLTGATPTRAQADARTPTKGALALTGAAPGVANGVIRTPTKGALALTGATPTLREGWTIAPSKAALSLTGRTPDIGGAITVAPTKAAVVLTGTAPTLIAGTVRAPSAATLTVTGSTPTLDESYVIAPAAATLTLTGGTPSTIRPHVVSDTLLRAPQRRSPAAPSRVWLVR